MHEAAWTPPPPPYRVVAPEAARPADGRKSRGTLGWDIALGIDLGVVALLAVAGVVVWAVSLAQPSPGPTDADAPGVRAVLWFGGAFNLVVFGAVPLAWVLGTRVRPWEGTRRFLQLHGSWRPALAGTGVGLAMVALVLPITLGIERLGWAPEGGSEFLFVTWPLAVFLSLVAGVTEEILFRGVLQKWLGVWGQAGVFGLMHLGNAGWLSFLLTAAIGLLLGWLVKRGHSLWLVIVAHVVYDLVLFSIILLWPGAGG